jgi:predicted glutamine amidotransferase
MCELLALSANTPTDLRFSFHGLRLRGGSTGDHADGWGLASYDIDGLGVRIYREDAPRLFHRSLRPLPNSIYAPIARWPTSAKRPKAW